MTDWDDAGVWTCHDCHRLMPPTVPKYRESGWLDDVICPTCRKAYEASHIADPAKVPPVVKV